MRFLMPESKRLQAFFLIEPDQYNLALRTYARQIECGIYHPIWNGRHWIRRTHRHCGMCLLDNCSSHWRVQMTTTTSRVTLSNKAPQLEVVVLIMIKHTISYIVMRSKMKFKAQRSKYVMLIYKVLTRKYGIQFGTSSATQWLGETARNYASTELRTCSIYMLGVDDGSSASFDIRCMFHGCSYCMCARIMPAISTVSAEGKSVVVARQIARNIMPA